jgi:putative inorganic carbon (hco3(-)) transporter
MAKTAVKKGMPNKITTEPLKLIHIVLLIAYGFVTVLTPNLNTLDSNGPKFLTMALLNLLTFAYLFSLKEKKAPPALFSSFFINAIGAVYTLLMVISLFSFINAFNKIEAVLHFAKIFTTFSAAFLVSNLVLSEKRGILYLAVAMSLLLIFDSLTVYSEIGKYIQGKIQFIGNIKSVYSNKNILAASIFVKIPFALWLFISGPKWRRIFGGASMFLAMIAIFFMSSRAFYIGSLMLTLVLSVYFFIKYYQDLNKIHLKTLGMFLGMVAISYLIFSVTQSYLYPRSKDAMGVSVGERMASITKESEEGLRLNGWKRSWHVFKEHPLLGVGLGNWKIATLKEENLTKNDYTYQYKAHNDFIETATETGIFGGILFLSIFILTGWKFLQLLFKHKSSESLYTFSLPTFGLFCYSFDAFFNFPQDRPEIQALFALFTGIAVALSSQAFLEKQENNPDFETNKFLQLEMPYIHHWLTGKSSVTPSSSSHRPITGWILPGLFLILIAGSSYILILNFNSLKLQRIIKQEINTGKLTSPANMFVEGFPFIPNLNVVGEPIAAQKARYLINEKRYNEAISILKNDHASPYDTRPEYFLAMAYYEKKMPDSAMYYSGKVYEMKPYHFKNISILTNTMFQQGKATEAEKILEKYLSEKKKDKEASMFASSFYEKTGNIQKAINIIDSAGVWFPADTNVVKQKTYLHRRQVLITNKEIVDAALLAFREKKYQESIGYLNKLLNIYPSYAEAREYRAFSFFFQKEYAQSNGDLDILINSGNHRANLFNLRGVNFYNLGNLEEACKNFTIAKNMGDKDGTANYTRFCQTQKK